ncbi:MAG: sugar nucleotide-binding protein, partial [Thermoguttaceae bacterium]|nr:sugar nucleotide-binding protein [Thermoguttaceae bacterium]
MKIAVIGSGGTLGSAIARWWNTPAVTFGGEAAEDQITGVDLPDFNVASRRFALDTLKEIAPEVIVNCAALRFIDWAESHPNTARTIHVQGTANLRQAADRLGALLVQISCAEVFGDTDPDAPPRTEDDIPAPESVF